MIFYLRLAREPDLWHVADDRHLSSGPLLLGAGLLRCLRAADRLRNAPPAAAPPPTATSSDQVISHVRTAGRTTPSMRCSARTAATTSPREPCPGHSWPLRRRAALLSSQAAASTDLRTPPPIGNGAQPPETFDWVAEVWIDPAWYEAQQSPDPMPSPGLPVVVPLRTKSILIGRTSRSRNIHPQIDCEPDSGVSRRQTQLTTDGTRWWVEDLDSANGTFVAPATGPIPSDPIPVGVEA